MPGRQMNRLALFIYTQVAACLYHPAALRQSGGFYRQIQTPSQPDVLRPAFIVGPPHLLPPIPLRKIDKGKEKKKWMEIYTKDK